MSLARLPMKTSPQSGSMSTAVKPTVQRAPLAIKKRTENALRGPKLPLLRTTGSLNSGRRGKSQIVQSASYPFSSGPWTRQGYGYYSTSPQSYEEENEVEDTRPFGNWLKTVKSGSSLLVTALTRFVLRLTPEGTSKQTVETGVKAGLVLIALMFARSILSLLIAIGSVGVLMFVGSKLLGPNLNSNHPAFTDEKQRTVYQRRYYQPGMYYPPGSYYSPPPGVYDPVDPTVIDPWTADVLTVWREPVQPQVITPSFQYQQLTYRTRYGYKPLDDVK